MLSLPKQSVKCFLNADLNGQLELDTKESQVALYMFSIEGFYYPVNKDNILAYFYDEFFDEYLVIKKGFYSDCNWKHPDKKFWEVQHEWDLINPLQVKQV